MKMLENLHIFPSAKESLKNISWISTKVLLLADPYHVLTSGSVEIGAVATKIPTNKRLNQIT